MWALEVRVFRAEMLLVRRSMTERLSTRLDTISAIPQLERPKFENTPEPSVLRIKQRKRGWVPISLALIDDARLQFDTRAVATWLIAKPDGWQIRVAALPYLLQRRAGPGERMGRDRVRRMLRELENAGYLTRARSKKPDGRWAWRVELSDTAVPFDRSSAMDGSAIDGQGVDLLNTLNHPRLDKFIPTTTTGPEAIENAVGVPLMEVQYPDILKGGHLRAFVGGSRKQLIHRRKPRAIHVGMRPFTLGVTDGIVWTMWDFGRR